MGQCKSAAASSAAVSPMRQDRGSQTPTATATRGAATVRSTTEPLEDHVDVTYMRERNVRADLIPLRWDECMMVDLLVRARVRLVLFPFGGGFVVLDSTDALGGTSPLLRPEAAAAIAATTATTAAATTSKTGWAAAAMAAVCASPTVSASATVLPSAVAPTAAAAAAASSSAESSGSSGPLIVMLGTELSATTMPMPWARLTAREHARAIRKRRERVQILSADDFWHVRQRAIDLGFPVGPVVGATATAASAASMAADGGASASSAVVYSSERRVPVADGPVRFDGATHVLCEQAGVFRLEIFEEVLGFTIVAPNLHASTGSCTAVLRFGTPPSEWPSPIDAMTTEQIAANRAAASSLARNEDEPDGPDGPFDGENEDVWQRERAFALAHAPVLGLPAGFHSIDDLFFRLRRCAGLVLRGVEAREWDVYQLKPRGRPRFDLLRRPTSEPTQDVHRLHLLYEIKSVQTLELQRAPLPSWGTATAATAAATATPSQQADGPRSRTTTASDPRADGGPDGGPDRGPDGGPRSVSRARTLLPAQASGEDERGGGAVLYAAAAETEVPRDGGGGAVLDLDEAPSHKRQ